MTDKKRVQVSPTLTLPTDDSIYIAGDGAGTQFSGLAQTAVDHGQYVGKTIAQRIAGIPTSPFEPKQGVFVIPVGRKWAILNFKDFVMSGFTPWIMRIMVDARYFLSIASLGTVLGMLRKSTK